MHPDPTNPAVTAILSQLPAMDLARLRELHDQLTQEVLRRQGT